MDEQAPDTIQVESIRRLDIKAGETLVVTVPPSSSAKDVQKVADALQSKMPRGVQVLVLSVGMDLGVISSEPTTVTTPGGYPGDVITGGSGDPGLDHIPALTLVD